MKNVRAVTTAALALTVVTLPLISGCPGAGGGGQSSMDRDAIMKRRQEYSQSTQKGGKTQQPSGDGTASGGTGSPPGPGGK